MLKAWTNFTPSYQCYPDLTFRISEPSVAFNYLQNMVWNIALLWFGSDLLPIQTFVLPAYAPPPTPKPPDRTTICSLETSCSLTLLYLATWWFLWPMWLSHLFPPGRVLHMGQDRGQNFIFSVTLSSLLHRITFPFCLHLWKLCAFLYNKLIISWCN